MGSFKVHRTYFHAMNDLFVFAGEILAGPIEPGMWMELPIDIHGPSKVPVFSIEFIELKNRPKGAPPITAITVEYKHMAIVPEWNLGQIDGRVLEIYS